MRVLIVEDEPTSARLLASHLQAILGNRLMNMQIRPTLVAAQCHIQEQAVDLLFLDLDLNGEDSFQILNEAVAGSFQTIIVSGNLHRAMEAFEIGVLDFIPKPVTEDRVLQALRRYDQSNRGGRESLKSLSVNRDGIIDLIPLHKIAYIRANRKTSVIVMLSGQERDYAKSLGSLELILPDNWKRIHKSYIVPLHAITGFSRKTEAGYFARLETGPEIPVSRSAFDDLRGLLTLDS